MTFDINQISDAGIRQEFVILTKRSQAIFKDVSSSLGHGKLPIELSFINDGSFNAYAGKGPSNYKIEINAAVPLLSLMLFTRLFSDPAYFGHIQSDGALVSDFVTPAIIDIRDFEKRTDWAVQLNAARSFSAGTMADICSTFTVCHELGHIIAGHVDAVREIEGRDGIRELVSIVKAANERTECSQAWECDADAVSATLMVNFVEELSRNARTNPKVGAMFAERKNHLTEEVLASVCSALFAFFAYVDGVKKQINVASSHPHAVVRAFYFKDMICKAMEQRAPFDFEAFSKIVDRQVDEALSVLEKMELFDPNAFSDEFLDQMDSERARMILIQQKYRAVALPWSWISWG